MNKSDNNRCDKAKEETNFKLDTQKNIEKMKIDEKDVKQQQRSSTDQSSIVQSATVKTVQFKGVCLCGAKTPFENMICGEDCSKRGIFY